MQGIGLLLGLHVGDKLDDTCVTLNFDDAWLGLKQLHSKQEVVGWLIIVRAGWGNRNREACLRHEVLELQFTLRMDEVTALLS